jgi:hypothetical protein
MDYLDSNPETLEKLHALDQGTIRLPHLFGAGIFQYLNQ